MPAPFHAHFRRHDPVLHAVIRRVGPYTLRPNRDRFGMLVSSIVSQQISTAAARAIKARLAALVTPRTIEPAAIQALGDARLRSAGLSRQKIEYLRDLSRRASDGRLKLATIGRLGDDAIIRQLSEIKGIGTWTAQMFLIFSLGRPDVFPAGDFGVRAAIARLYGHADLPPKGVLHEIGQRWSPYATIGSWYCWRYLDGLTPAERRGKA
jgi:DNA-3-methyladenine glycosylase II